MPIVYTIVITKNTIDAPSLIYISFTKYLFFQAFTFKKNNTIIKKINIIKILSNIDYPPKNNHYTNHITILYLLFQIITQYLQKLMLLLMFYLLD